MNDELLCRSDGPWRGSSNGSRDRFRQEMSECISDDGWAAGMARMRFSRPERREVMTLLEISHEVNHTLAGGRKVTTYRIIVFRSRTPLARAITISRDSFLMVSIAGGASR